MFGEYFIFLLFLDDDATGIRQVILPANSHDANSRRPRARAGAPSASTSPCRDFYSSNRSAFRPCPEVVPGEPVIGRVTTAEFYCRALNSIAPPSDSNSRSGGPEARALPLSHRNKPKSAKILAELMRSSACASVCTMTKRVLNVWGIRKSAYQLIYFRNIPFSVSQFTY